MPKAIGTKFSATIGTVPAMTVIAGLTNIGGPEMSADAIDSTTHDITDGFRTFEQGLKDGGSVAIEGKFKNDQSQEDLFKLFTDGTTVAMKIEFPASLATWTFDGFVEAYSTGAPLEDDAEFSASIKISGKPTLA